MTIFELARQARANRNTEVWLRADGAVGLNPMEGPDLGKLPVDVREIHFHPRKNDSLEQARELLKEARLQYPEASVHGLSPGWWSRHGELLDVDSLCWFTGELGDDNSPASKGWQKFAELDLPKVACLVYGPEHTPAQLEARLQAIAAAPKVTQLVALPRSVGDLVVIPGATTDGTWDVEMLARCRAALPPSIRVRASWGALGYKMAQSALAFGCDGLAGWGLEEHLAYSGRMRPADVVGWDQAREGLEEASK